MSDLDVYLSGEQVYWRGKPDRKCFVLECIFNPLLIFALIWLVFDLGFIFLIAGDTFGVPKGLLPFLAVFFLFHLMPVWIYLGGVLLAARRQHNMEYAITDRGVYFAGGIITKTVTMKPFAEISSVNMTRGFIDRKTDCGDVTFTFIGNTTTAGTGTLAIRDIPDYQRVFQMVKQMQTDIFSDTMYPNALRPGSNPGYRTQYQPDSMPENEPRRY
ncbi:MAG: PH domain-containing protein [Lachnospiraceae bacterium]|nr:PH domain-containing protein [Lachnospiraceae bacterium]